MRAGRWFLSPLVARRVIVMRAVCGTGTMRAADCAPMCLTDLSTSGRRDRYDRSH